MIVIETGDLIEGDATSATEVDFQIYGLDNNALSNLADGQLASSKGTLYTSNSTDVITAIILVNTGAAHNHVNLYHKGATSRRLIPKDLELGIGYALYFEGGKCHVLDTTGRLLETYGTTGIADDNFLTVDDAAAADDNFARFTANGIEGLTVAESIAALLAATIPENTSVDLEDVLTADGKYSGITMAGVAGATLAFGDLVYLQTADARWELASADNAAAGCNLLLGVCVLAAAGDGNATKALLYGTIRADTAFPDLTLGAPAYLSTTAGDVQVAAPSGATDIIRIVGHGGYTKEELIFAPSPDWFEHV